MRETDRVILAFAAISYRIRFFEQQICRDHQYFFIPRLQGEWKKGSSEYTFPVTCDLPIKPGV
ncbi:MAG: hypothetical protein D4R67_09945, partial [Bacteroidetes bacterium]